MASYTFVFYKFAKRTASTKKPTGDGVTITGVLKEPTNIVNPTIEIKSATFDFNYCYCQDTGRYYWIREQRVIAYGTRELDMKCDVLASWISEAIGQRVYAISSAVFYDDMIDDDRVVPINEYEIPERAYGELSIIGSVSSGNIPTYQFVSVVNDAGKLNGIDVFYGDSILDTYMQSLADMTFWQGLAMNAGGVNAFEAINEVWATPLIPSECHATGYNSALLYQVPIAGNCLASIDVKNHRNTINIPKPSYTDFRYCDKYVKYYLNIPYIGVITIPTELTHNVDVLEYSYAGDCLTGQVCVAVRIKGVNLGTFGTSLKAPLSLANQQSHVAQMVMSTAKGAALAGAAGAKLGGAGGAIGGAVGGAIGGLTRGVVAMPEIDRLGSSVGSIAPLGTKDLTGNLVLVMVEAHSNENPANYAAIAGRPTQKIVTLSANCGYMLTGDAQFSLPATSAEIEEFNNLFNSGVYVE